MFAYCTNGDWKNVFLNQDVARKQRNKVLLSTIKLKAA